MAQNLRYCLRMLLKTPGCTTVAVLTLALGIGANTAILSVFQAVLLQPLPYRNPESLVRVWNTYTNFTAVTQLALSPGDFYDYQKQAQSFAGMAAYVDFPQGFNLTGQGEPQHLEARYATSQLLPLLGIQAVVGRVFTPDEDKPGATPTVMISHRLWQGHFGSDASVLGRTVRLDGRGFTVIGVLPATFHLSPAADLWMPVGQYGDDLSNQLHHEFTVIARLKPGILLTQAQAEIDTINHQEEGALPDTHKNWKVLAGEMQNPAAAKLRPALMVLFGAVVFVLLIACANVVNLILARNAARQKEIAVRIALGASWSRLLVQLLTESVVLSGLGAALALVLAVAGLRLLDSLAPPNLAALTGVKLNWWVLGMMAATSLAAGIVCGLIPALQILKQDANSVLKAGGRTSGMAVGRGTRDILVVSETAMAIVLLLAAGLLIRSFYSVMRVSPGFQTDQVLSLEVDRPAVPLSDFVKMTPAQQAELARKQSELFEQLADSIKVLPGVRAVGGINVLPLAGEIRSASRFIVEGQPLSDASARPVAEVRNVSLGYFSAMGIPLRKGRWFNRQDYAGTNLLVNEELARRFWPGVDPTGKRINLCSLGQKPCWYSVVGVVGNVHQYGLDAAALSLDMYFAGGPTPYMVIRTDQDPNTLARAASNAIHKNDPNLPVTQVASLSGLLSGSLSPRRFAVYLLAIFAGLAMALAAVGIYGVMNYIVGLGTREIGLRIALGAQPGSVWRLVVFRGLRLAVMGMVLGIAGGLAANKIIASMLYGVPATDPVTIAGVVLLLAFVVLIACHIPARRALRVDPIVALHEE